MIEEKICPECGEPYEGSLMEHLMKTRHNETVGGLKRLYIKIADLERRLAESADREQSLVLQLAEAEEKIRKSNVCLRAASELAEELKEHRRFELRQIGLRLKAALGIEAPISETKLRKDQS